MKDGGRFFMHVRVVVDDIGGVDAALTSSFGVVMVYESRSESICNNGVELLH